MSIGLGGHLVLALGHMLAVDAPPAALVGEPLALATAVLVLGALAAALVRPRGSCRSESEWRLALDGLALVVGGYTAALVFDGPMLVAVLAIAAVVLAQLAQRTGDELAALGPLPRRGGVPRAGVRGAAGSALLRRRQPHRCGVAVGACGLAALACAHQRTSKAGRQDMAARPLVRRSRLALYLASVGIVTAFQPGGAETTVLDLPVRQQGQVLVSALWGLAGLCALLSGLRRDLREVRLGGLALLMITVGKVFLYDLAALGSVYRVLSFLALGTLLLAASFAYQRLRPTPLPDLREAARAALARPPHTRRKEEQEMTHLTARMSAIIKAKVSKLLDRAEHPAETLDYSYQRQLEHLQGVKRGIADVITAKKRLQMQAGALGHKWTGSTPRPDRRSHTSARTWRARPWSRRR